MALAGLEPELLEQVAAECGGAPWWECDVTDRAQVQDAVDGAVERLGGLDVVVANAGVASQAPLIGGDPTIFERTGRREPARRLLHPARRRAAHRTPGGYALTIASVAAALHVPMLGPYSASKAGVEALGDTLRVELYETGARVGVAYFGFVDTDMVSRGMQTRAAEQAPGRRRAVVKPVPLALALDAIERGVERRSRHVTAPRWVPAVLVLRTLLQPLVERGVPSWPVGDARVGPRGARPADNPPAGFLLTER